MDEKEEPAMGLGHIEFIGIDGKTLLPKRVTSFDIRERTHSQTTSPSSSRKHTRITVDVEEAGWTIKDKREALIEFDPPVKIAAFRLVTGADDEARDPVKWVVECSKDKIRWNKVHEQSRRYPSPRQRNSATRWFKLNVEEWNVAQWLEGTGLLDLIAERLCPQPEKFSEKEVSVDCVTELMKDSFVGLFKDGAFVEECAATLAEAVQILKETEPATDRSWTKKFQADDTIIHYKYGNLETFYGGLEALVDLPNPQILEGMFEDHCVGPKDTDVEVEWKTDNYSIRTKSMTEWGFVVHAEEGEEQSLKMLRRWANTDRHKMKEHMLTLGNRFSAEPAIQDTPGTGQPQETAPPITWAEFEVFYCDQNSVFEVEYKKRPEEAQPKWPSESNTQRPRKPRSLEDFRESWAKVNELMHSKAKTGALPTGSLSSALPPWLQPRGVAEQFLIAELIGARLYTGPMFEKYNGRLRYYTGDKFLQDRCKVLCKENMYTTTLHVINSALIKLGKVLPAKKVYRGLTGGVLPKEFLEANDHNCKGGVEFGFTSTTTDRNVAVHYTKSKKARMIFELQLGMVDKGADLGWLSQYPHEKEICLSPLAGMEVIGTSIEGATLVLNVRLNVNMMAATIEQVMCKRFKLLRELTINTRKEIDLYLKGWQGEGTLLYERGLVQDKDLRIVPDRHFEEIMQKGQKDKDYYNIVENLRDGLVETVNQIGWVVGAKAVSDVVSALKLVGLPEDKEALAPCPLLPQGEMRPFALGDGPEYDEERRYWTERERRTHVLEKGLIKKESQIRDCDRCEQRFKQFDEYGVCKVCNAYFCISCANEVAVKHLLGAVAGGKDEAGEGQAFKPLLEEALAACLGKLDEDRIQTIKSLFKARFISCDPTKDKQEGNLRAILLDILRKPQMYGSEQEFLKEIVKEKLREHTFKEGAIYPELQLVDERINSRALTHDDMRSAGLTPADMPRLGFSDKEVYEASRRGGAKAHLPFQKDASVIAHVFTKSTDRYVIDKVTDIVPPHAILQNNKVKIFLTTGNNRFTTKAGELEQWEVNICEWRVQSVFRGPELVEQPHQGS